jgi:hypothetical protein
MTVKGNHPLAEIIARKLFGIEMAQTAEQRKMVSRAIKAAVEYHNTEVERKDETIKTMKKLLLSVESSEYSGRKMKKEVNNDMS